MTSPAAGTLDGYRDGARWIAFARSGRFEQGREWLSLRAGGRSFHAQVGPHAVVQVRSGLRGERMSRRWQRLQLRPVRVLSHALGIYLVAGSDHEDGAALAARLSAERDFASVSPDLFTPRKRASIPLPPNDPRYGGQWYLQTLHIEDAWRISSGARDVTVTIIDNGCDLKHPDLVAQFVAGRDAFASDDDPSFVPNQLGNAHGTACAGIVAAAGNNGLGIVGTCPECTLSCVRLLNNIVTEGVPLSADIEAFDFAFRSGAAVVSNSWGFAESVPVASALAAAVRRVAEQGNGGRGAVVVFAAGNENRALAADEIAALPYVLAVGAINQFDESAPFANYGAALDLSAPTGSLTTDISGSDGDDRGDYTNLFGGTSAACPVLAGVAGLAMAYAKSATSADVRRALIESARKAPYATPDAQGHDTVYGFGIVDPAAALRALRAFAPDAGTVEDAGADASPVAMQDASPADAARANDAALTAWDASDSATEAVDAQGGVRADAGADDVGANASATAEPPPVEPRDETSRPPSEPEQSDDAEDEPHETDTSAASAGTKRHGGCSLGASDVADLSAGGWLSVWFVARRRRRTPV